MYWVSRLAGRPLVVRYGRYFFISPEKIESAERWSARYGGFGVFASRLLPVVRHLIGIPSGIVRLNFSKYTLQTVLGSLTWCAVLSWVGVLAGNDKALMAGDMRAVTLWIVAAVLGLGALYYFFVHRQMRRAA
jgi:membrane protein DedA with SNARE-associated domain